MGTSAVAWPQSVLVGYLGKILYDGHFSVSLTSLFSCTLDTIKKRDRLKKNVRYEKDRV